MNYGDQVWHWRIILAGLASSDTKAIILTPDGDVYEEDFAQAQAVRWLGPNNEIPAGVPRTQIYHFGDQFPSSRALQTLMQEATLTAAIADRRAGVAPLTVAQQLQGSGGGGSSKSVAFVPAEVPTPGKDPLADDGGPGPGPAGLKGNMGLQKDTQVPGRPVLHAGAVREVKWVAAESVTWAGGGIERGEPISFNGSEQIIRDRGVMMMMGRPVLIADIGGLDVAEYKAAEAHHDARILRMQRDYKQARHRPWRDVVRDMAPVPADDWPVPGPRTAAWCCQFLEKRGDGPVTWDRRWRSDNKLQLDQWGVAEHESLAKMAERMGMFDQCDVPNLACAEDLFRRMQLIEYFYYEASRKKEGGQDKDKKNKAVRLEEAALFTGKHRDFGECMVAPELLDYVAKELERDSSIMKQMRKAREERDLAGKHDK